MSMSSSPSAAETALDPRPGLFVLLVEDNEADAYLIERALTDNPMVGRVSRARDGEEALAMVKSAEILPDLALIDLHMPRMDGFDLLVAFATQPGLDFPMVVLTSSSARNDAIRSRLRSAVRVLIKPDTVAELYAVLKTAIEEVCHPQLRAAATRSKTPGYLLLGVGTAASLLRRPASDDA
jgi:CheY-like chemotaxis protein